MYGSVTRIVPFPINGNTIGLLEHNNLFDNLKSVIFVGNLVSYDEVAEEQRKVEKSCYDLTKSTIRKECLVHNPTVSIKAAENFSNAISLAKSRRDKFFVIPGENDLQYLFSKNAKFETAHKLREPFKRSRIEHLIPEESTYTYVRQDVFKLMRAAVFSNGYLVTFGGITKKWIEEALPELSAVGFGVVSSMTLEKALNIIFHQRNPDSSLYLNEKNVKSPFFVQDISLKPEDYYSGISQIFYSPEADEHKKLKVESVTVNNAVHYIAKMPRVLYSEENCADGQFTGFDLKPTI